MTDDSATLEIEASLNFMLDRSLPISVTAQLRGQIEYGIATGEIAPGTKLPSVRQLARNLAVAPVTVSHVYKDLQEAGLLASQQGRGTYVPDRLPPTPEAGVLAALHRAVEDMFAKAEAMGVTQLAAAEAAMLRASQMPTTGRGLRLLYVGIYEKATEGYADHVRRHLPKTETIRATTFERLTSEGLPDPPFHAYLTLANREKELRGLVGPDAAIMALPLIPSTETRTRLAALAPDTRLAVTAGVPEFLPTLLRNVARYAPHVRERRIIPYDQPTNSEVANWCNALVYATGADVVLQHLPSGLTAFEFRHEPEPSVITGFVLPLLGSLRHSVANKESADEDK